MIALKKGDVFLDMLPKASIKLQIRTNIFNLEVIESTRSLPFTIPFTKTNKRELNHLQRADSLTKINSDIPVDLYYKGNFYKRGVFRVSRIRASGYEGEFIADAGVLSDKKDTNIQTLLSEETFDLQQTTTDALYSNYGKNDDVCFPRLFNWNTQFRDGEFVGQICPVLNQSFTPPRLVNNAFRALPCFKASFVFNKIINLLNMNSNFETDTLFQKLVFWNNKSINTDEAGFIEPIVNIASHIPFITLKEFLKGFKINFGFAYFVDTANQVFNVKTIDAILNSEEKEDWTEFFIPPGLPEPNADSISGFAPFIDRNNQFNESLSENELSNFELLGEVNTFADLPTIDISALNKGYLVLEEGKYYAARWLNATTLFDWTDGSLLEWQEITAPFDGAGDKSKQSPFGTIYKKKQVIVEHFGYIITAFAPTSYVVPEQMYHYNPSPGDPVTMEVKFTNLRENGFTGLENWYTTSQFDGVAFYVDMPNEPDLNFQTVTYQLRYTFETHIPATYINASAEQQNQFSSEFPPLLLIMQTDNLAIPDNYDEVELGLGNETLYWNGESGLQAKRWDSYKAFAENTRLIKQLARLSFRQLQSFNPLKKYRVRDIDYLIKEIQVNLQHDRIGIAEVDMWRV